MAQRLGFKPKSLIKNIPSPKDRWKQPVKYWIRELYEKRFGHVLGAQREAPHKPPAAVPEPDFDFEFEFEFDCDPFGSSDPSWLPEFRDDDVPF